MSTKNKSEPTTASSVQFQMDRLTLENKRLKAKLEVKTDELKFAKTELKKIESDYKARVSNSLKLDIQDVLGCTDMELAKLTHGKCIEELEAMLSHIMLVQTDNPTSPKGKFKPINIDAAPAEYGAPENFTVGDLFGKTAKEIREMGGRF